MVAAIPQRPLLADSVEKVEDLAALQNCLNDVDIFDRLKSAL
jgi:hypothetical protein